MNWRNPFLTTYLAVTVGGTAILSYLLYTGYANYATTSETYDAEVAKLQGLQHKRPFPSAENNRAYTALTAEYRAEYDKLLAQVSKMQKPLEKVTPQTFQDRLRTYVSEVMTAAKQNGVEINDSFYLGFDDYRDRLPSNEAAGPLARELDAIRLVVDRLVEFKARKVLGIQRERLPEEGGGAKQEESAPTGSRIQRPVAKTPKVITSTAFDVAFVADQNVTRQALNAIATANQFFFVIRNMTVQNETLEGPKRQEDVAAIAQEQPAEGGEAKPTIRLLAGRETLTVVAHIEMVTFNPPESQK
jgi:hypothetical protein